MARWKKPTKIEISEMRRRIAERANAGELRFPEAVGELRRAIGLTQDQFAQMMRMTKRQVAEIESGNANPTFETMNKIGKVFGFTVGYIPKTTPHLDDEAAPPGP